MAFELIFKKLEVLSSISLSAPHLSSKFTLSQVEIDGKNRVSFSPPKDPISDVARRKWLAGKPGTSFSVRELSALTWEPEIATSQAFLDKLLLEVGAPSARMLKGLLNSHHVSWKKLNGQRIVSLAAVLSSSASVNRTVQHWRRHISLIASVGAPRALAEQALSRHVGPDKLFDYYRIPVNSGFEREYYDCLLDKLLGQQRRLTESDKDYLFNVVLRLKRLDISLLKSALSQLILSPWVEEDPKAKELLIRFVLTHPDFGDPRLHPQRWEGLLDARLKVTQWLSAADITLFFDLIIRPDPHSRAAFWKDYAPHVVRSRVLLSPKSRAEYRTELEELEADGRHFCDFTTKAKTSAFVMDFGTLIAVEFSEVNNALYFYTPETFRTVLKNFWGAVRSAQDLKATSHAIGWVRHSPDKWQAEARRALSQHGIRLGQRR